MKTLIADRFLETHIARLTELGCEVTYKPSATAAELPSLIGPYKILVVRGKEVTADTIKASDQLALVVRAGAGVNTIDIKAASARGVFVSNCPGKNSIAVAELVRVAAGDRPAHSRKRLPCVPTSGIKSNFPKPTASSEKPSVSLESARLAMRSFFVRRRSGCARSPGRAR